MSCCAEKSLTLYCARCGEENSCCLCQSRKAVFIGLPKSKWLSVNVCDNWLWEVEIDLWCCWADVTTAALMLLPIFSQQLSMHSMQGASSWYFLWGLTHYRILLTGLLLRCSSQDFRKQPVAWVRREISILISFFIRETKGNINQLMYLIHVLGHHTYLLN